jgi:molybdopterin molybdotransferase
MISADDALALVLANVEVLGVERTPILSALWRVLAEQIRSPRYIPGFDNSAMDGYAVRADDVKHATDGKPIALMVVEEIPAGTMPSRRLGVGEAARIMTGAPLPTGADTIVPVERTRAAGAEVEVLAPSEPGAFIRPRGEDVREGEVVMSPGRRLKPADLGMLASINRSMVEVYRRPRVAIVATGNELVDVDQAPSGAQVVNSSGYALYGGVQEAGGEPIVLKLARDRPEDVRARLSEALAFDVVLSTGGVSVGQFDHVKEVLDELGMRQIFHGVAQKPGRPLKFGLIGKRPVFGLPGNPVSTMVCFYLYVRPAILKMAGRHDLGLRRLNVRCAVDIKTSRDVTEFVRVRLAPRGDELLAAPTGSQGSGILSSLSRADGLLIGPARETILKAGSQATVLALADESAADREAFFEERRLQSH